MLHAPIVPNFVRAPTDNDAGGAMGPGTAHAARWLQLGLDRLTVTGAELELQEASEHRVELQARRLCECCLRCLCGTC